LIFVFSAAKLGVVGMSTPTRSLAELALADVACVEHVGGERSFRRRLMELGLVPGTRVELKAVAPLGDPLELLVRGSSLSIRRADAALVRVTPGMRSEAPAAVLAPARLPATPVRGAP
jgi:Fe2+ transport system protein FeoA